jgi:hypothetical protein
MRVLSMVVVLAVAGGFGVGQPAEGGGWDDQVHGAVYIHHYLRDRTRFVRFNHVHRWGPRILHVYHGEFPFRGMGPTFAYARYRYFHHWRGERWR